MFRARLSDALKTAMKAKEERCVSTLRLIIAALKDRDIAARGKGNLNGIGDAEILGMLQSMIKQRRESIAMYEKGGRLELAEQEAEEIDVIERYLPEQMDDKAMSAAVESVIGELGAETMKDMGRTMALLKERHAGCMDFAKASALLKGRLG